MSSGLVQELRRLEGELASALAAAEAGRRRAERELAEATPLQRARVFEVAGDAVAQLGLFVRELVFRLGEHARDGGSAYGAAAVAKTCGRDFGLDVDGVVVSRPTRAELESRGARAAPGWRRDRNTRRVREQGDRR